MLTLSESISNPLITAQLATGNIRNYQLVVGGLQLLNIPVSYVFLKLGAVPEVTAMVAVAISQICLFARLYMLKSMIDLHAGDFLKKVYLNLIVTTALAMIIPLLVNPLMPDNVWGFLSSVAVCVVSSGLAVWLYGLSKGERHEVVDMVMKRLKS